MHPQYTPQDIARFWSRVEKTDGCWLWRGVPSQKYGSLGINGKNYHAHRVSYEIHHGPIPDGLFVCHRCDVGRCVNPEHLFLGTHQDNMTDLKTKKRKARGDQHHSRLRPEIMARGERNGAYTHPERRPRGERNGSMLHPERLPRGEAQHLAKMTAEKVQEIRALFASHTMNQPQLAVLYGVNQTTISGIVRRRLWKHVN